MDRLFEALANPDLAPHVVADPEFAALVAEFAELVARAARLVKEVDGKQT